MQCDFLTCSAVFLTCPPVPDSDSNSDSQATFPVKLSGNTVYVQVGGGSDGGLNFDEDAGCGTAACSGQNEKETEKKGDVQAETQQKGKKGRKHIQLAYDNDKSE